MIGKISDRHWSDRRACRRHGGGGGGGGRLWQVHAQGSLLKTRPSHFISCSFLRRFFDSDPHSFSRRVCFYSVCLSHCSPLLALPLSPPLSLCTDLSPSLAFSVFPSLSPPSLLPSLFFCFSSLSLTLSPPSLRPPVPTLLNPRR